MTILWNKYVCLWRQTTYMFNAFVFVSVNPLRYIVPPVSDISPPL